MFPSLLEFVLNSSNASGDHGSSGERGMSGLGDGASRCIAMSCKDDITYSMASRKGDGVRPWTPGEGGIGECPGVIAVY